MTRILPLALALLGLSLLVTAFYPVQTVPGGAVRLVDLVEKLPADRIQQGYDPLPEGQPLGSGLEPLLAATFEDGTTSQLDSITLLECFPNNLRTADVSPADIVAAALAPEPGRPENHVLRFPRPSGGAAVALAAHADTPYLLRARVRRPVDPADAKVPSFYGTVLVQELRRWPKSKGGNGLALEVNDTRDPITVLHGAHVSVAAQADAWCEVQILFKSTVYTNALMIGVIAGAPNKGGEGEVLFDDITLTELPLRRYFSTPESFATDELVQDRTFSTRTRSVKIFADVRDAILMPPPSQVQLEVLVPKEAPRLTFGYGVLEEQRNAGSYPVRFELRATAGNQQVALLEASLQPRTNAGDLGWHEAAIDLGMLAGQRATLTFSTSSPGGDDVAVIGSPVLFSAHDDRPSVILISIDTLRADHVGCYGHQRDTTPFLDRFFTEQGVYFTDFSAAAPYTLPSHASLFSGQFPTVHEVQQADHRLVDASPHLADILAQQGYVTAAFTGGGFVGYEYGFRRGFDRFAIVDPLLAEDDHDRDFRPRLHDRQYNNRVFRDYRIDRALRFVRDHEGSPFFLFLHTFVVHNYVPPAAFKKAFPRADQFGDQNALTLHEIDIDPKRREQFGPEQLAIIKDVYDATIRAADDAVRQVVEALRSEHLLDKTIVIVTSDHGEEFQEHGGLLHGRTLYEEQLHVPLFLSFPGLARRGAVPGLASHVDLAPTVLELLGLNRDPRMNGVSLLPLLRGEPVHDRVWAELDTVNMGEKYAVRTRDYKFIQSPRSGMEKALPELAYRNAREQELYHLPSDPGEHDERSGRDARATASLRDQLEDEHRALREARARLGPLDNKIDQSEQLMDHLRHLGYPGGARKK